MLASCSHIVALVLLLFAYPHSARSSVSRVHLVAHDATTNNFLFRGGMPQTEGGAFDYANLTLAMRNAAAIEGNLTLPPSFYLQDISLLNEAENAGLLEAERRFFAQNDFLGQLLHWTKVGSGESPALFNSTERKKKALALDNWSLDRVSKQPRYIIFPNHIIPHIRFPQPSIISLACCTQWLRPRKAAG